MIKKKAAWWKKSDDDPTEKSNTAGTEEEPSIEDSKMALSLRILKKILSIRPLKTTEDPITVKPKGNPVNEHAQVLLNTQ